MTQIESIQKNIHFYKVELNKNRKVICKDQIEKLHIAYAENFYLEKLNNLKFSLKCAIKLT
jgi:hypothetical protein